MALSQSELTDMLERLDEIATALSEMRHRVIQELEEMSSENESSQFFYGFRN